MTTRRQVMRAFGQYVDYAKHFRKIKLGKAEGDRAEWARACKTFYEEYQDKLEDFLNNDGE